MVRVIAGEFKSRKLKTLEGTATRPTSDRLKQTLFNLVQRRIAAAAFLDCFAGSGSMGIEALSRGAAFVAFIESAPAAVQVIRQNLAALGEASSPKYQILSQKAEAGLRSLERTGRKFDIVFLDPPYADAEQYPRIFNQLQTCALLNEEALVIAEHSKFLTLPGQAMHLNRLREIRQGDSVLSLFHFQA
ncbi:MAG: 16S rRNA (guanine(966)-N(2))-methyltransferase RsmD [Acidobacteria bacterium]|nr:16S rRNA (guanine(966)-N(2))-methyltransferase RsmD [Acidobacteriota bacterium]MCI0620833.1 16S rRNA (guanine(966)-N(2))-methyltransferase RsmD [Acidobacteriota bacterium]MCI0721766.1 16S rRNA (guanine(966)-N(2))-methyltransferase RsmD [Acidobacteriota bacterium]